MKQRENRMPDMKDCRMIVSTHDATCYVMDTCCRDVTAEERAEIDRKIIHIYRQSLLGENRIKDTPSATSGEEVK